MTTTEADQIRHDIEETRRELSTNVDNLTEKVSPSAVVGRRVDKAKDAVSGVKDKVMGAMPSMPDSSPGEGAEAAKDKVTSATSGNPLAAGLVAFGAGWLISSILPSSNAERQAATQAKSMINEHSDSLSGTLHDTLDAVKDSMQDQVLEAVDAVKSSATDAVGTVKDDATSAKESISGSGAGSPKHAAGV
ncbi:MAG: DUF3618 domain-containing protein [Sporichthyaceae bacterium]